MVTLRMAMAMNMWKIDGAYTAVVRLSSDAAAGGDDEEQDKEERETEMQKRMNKKTPSLARETWQGGIRPHTRFV